MDSIDEPQKKINRTDDMKAYFREYYRKNKKKLYEKNKKYYLAYYQKNKKTKKDKMESSDIPQNQE